jgi:4-amino-4-deoxy-L-arabinose transferase-like glycosyltransferase
MRFQLDHDWQSNMSEPRALLGESTKTRLLLLLCAIWIFVGLIGHAPWKPFETHGISIIKSILNGGSLIAPLDITETQLNSPPLYYLTAALSAKLFSPVLPLHDGARLFNSVWLTILLLMVGMTGRELWSQGVGRHATFIMIGTIGLFIYAHSLNNQIASFAGIATSFYAMILMNRRPIRATVLLGLAMATAFLVNGFVPLIIIIAPVLLSIILFKNWRKQRYVIALLVASLISLPFIITWYALFQHHFPILAQQWWSKSLPIADKSAHFYYLNTLVWFAWPALPLAILGLWQYRKQMMTNEKFQFILIFFTTTLLILGFFTDARDINTLPLLLPLVALGAGSVETLKRSVAAALNWFGISVFATFGGLIWLGWIAMMTGFPQKTQERMRVLSGAYSIDFSWIAFLAALLMTIIWLIISIRTKLTKRATVTNWAIGMTFIWSLLMTLWLPMIDNAKSYESVFLTVKKQLPAEYQCINSLNVGSAQRTLLYYYADVKLEPLRETQLLNCDLYLIQDEKGAGKMTPGPEWQLIWQGKRPAERRESFRLFKLF